MSALTLRARCFLAAGAAAVLCGMQIGESDFVRIGLLAVAVPLLGWLLLRRTHHDVTVRRGAASIQVESGETAQVDLEVTNVGRRTGTLLMEEQLPAALGERRSFVVPPLEPGEHTRLGYAVRTGARGRYPLGPVHVRVADPLGMVNLTQTLPSTAGLLVTPRTEPLPRIPLTGRWAGTGELRTRELLGAGSPDVTIREYRVGDDLRRIHWPSSARADELMVRREELPWQARCTLLVDNRRISHRGYGARSSMETAVSVAASIVRTLVALDFDVRLVSATGRTSAHTWHAGVRSATLPEQLERLALMGLTRHDHLSAGWLEESHQGGMLLAVLGHLGQADRNFLAGWPAAGASAYAVVLDVATWDPTGATDPPATPQLRSAGWRATTLARGGSLAASWLELGR